MRVPGDILFAIGALFLAWYAVRLLRQTETHNVAGAALAA